MDIPEVSAVQGISSSPGRGTLQASDIQITFLERCVRLEILFLHILCSTGLNLGLLLGTDYEKKKMRLLQELQCDCRNFVIMV